MQVGRLRVEVQLVLGRHAVEVAGLRRSGDARAAGLLGLLERGLRPVAAHDVVGGRAGGAQVRRHHRELQRRAALQEEHGVVGADPEQRAEVGLGLLDDPLEGRRAVADLHHGHARPGVVEQLRLGLLEHAEGQDGRSRPEVVDSLHELCRHSGLCYPKSGRLWRRISRKPFWPGERLFLKAGWSAVSGRTAGEAFRELANGRAAHMGVRPTLKNLVDSYERRVIEEALRASEGNQRQAAKALGVLPTTLHEKMKRLGLLRRESRPGRPSRSPAEGPRRLTRRARTSTAACAAGRCHVGRGASSRSCCRPRADRRAQAQGPASHRSPRSCRA